MVEVVATESTGWASEEEAEHEQGFPRAGEAGEVCSCHRPKVGVEPEARVREEKAGLASELPAHC